MHDTRAELYDRLGLLLRSRTGLPLYMWVTLCWHTGVGASMVNNTQRNGNYQLPAMQLYRPADCVAGRLLSTTLRCYCSVTAVTLQLGVTFQWQLYNGNFSVVTVQW